MLRPTLSSSLSNTVLQHHAERGSTVMTPQIAAPTAARIGLPTATTTATPTATTTVTALAATDELVQIDVDPATASLTNLVRLAHLAASEPSHVRLLAERLHSACWQRSRQVRLYFDTASEPHLAPTGQSITRPATPAMTAAAELANETLAQLLHVTRAQISLPDRTSPAARILRQYAHALDRSRRPQTAAVFKRMVQIAGEAVHRDVAANLPRVRAQVAQAPTDCLVHWISALRAVQEAAQTATGPTDAWLQHTEASARRRWMQHDLTLDSVRSYFAQMQIDCTAQGAIGLAASARKIAATLPTAQQQQHFATRLNDNIFGRVFETRLMAQLIASPALGTVPCAQQLAGILVRHLSTLPSCMKDGVTKALSATLVSEPRFWFDRVPLLRQFITAAPGEQKRRALVTWLLTPPTSSYDCMAITLCACQLSIALKVNASAFAPWMCAAGLNYAQAVQPASRRLKNMTQPLLRPEGGILLLHQRPAFSHPAMRPGMRATLQHRPNLDSQSTVTRRALEHGLPYASGVSGTLRFTS